MMYEVFAIGAVGVGLALALTTIWSRRNTWVRGAAVAGWIALMPLVVGSAFFSLSHPAPWMPLVTVPGGEYTVLGAKMVQDVAIYVWLDFGAAHPRYFALPWNNDTANNLQGLLDAEKYGEIPGFTMMAPYEWSWDESPLQFHPLPQPKGIPDKIPQQEAPTRYDRSA